MAAARTTTHRGFAKVTIPFRDYSHTPERNMEVQESSIASARKLWIGPDELYVPLTPNEEPMLMNRAHLGEEQLRALRDALTAWLGDGEPAEVPES
ncbi:hypothetical protein [Microbacterium sp.]|uniref:hypothetical protein n=1 Tax=Microbacterium sp. TaxID=51671 RepID=UPI00260B2D1B|nr:hypothetical protein [Microbacterium sp.]MCV0336373.1 hypothetical protein [Microbacterium sp.]MCV0376689.1 hypothetical protein [Microbacterium sp.]MCV0391438.1 hypothetical protein [Microbacterium sp.]MCV0420044.1 hypothetical protein [Microbacterium sp.]MCV0423785.1 hypothetical protein [Microbacterium sp.]